MKIVSSRVGDFLASKASYPLAKKYDAKVGGAVNLASNESPYGPSPKVVKEIGREIGSIGLYPDPKAEKLKRAVGRYVGAKPDSISIGNGSDELMELLCKAFVDPGDRVLIPTPTFSMYELAVRTNGGRPVFYRLLGFGWEPRKLARAARGAKIAFVGRPNNPTGNGPDEKTIAAISKVVELLVVDEAYVDFSRGSLAGRAARSKNMVVLRTFSKAFGLAGLRVGYAVGNPEIVSVLERIRAPFNVNRMAQAAALAALGDLAYVRKVVKKIVAGRKRLAAELEKLGLGVFPSEGNFLMVNVSPWGLDSGEFCDGLARRKVFVRDLSGFRGAGDSYVRITVGTPAQGRKLVSALEDLRRDEVAG